MKHEDAKIQIGYGGYNNENRIAFFKTKKAAIAELMLRGFKRSEIRETFKRLANSSSNNVVTGKHIDGYSLACEIYIL